jgi:hypothetical protein
MTLVSMLKIWSGAFWGAPDVVPVGAEGTRDPAQAPDDGDGDHSGRHPDTVDRRVRRAAVPLLRTRRDRHHRRSVVLHGGTAVNRFFPTLFAIVVWLALWGEISMVNVASGVLVVAILALLFRSEPREHTAASACARAAARGVRVAARVVVGHGRAGRALTDPGPPALGGRRRRAVASFVARRHDRRRCDQPDAGHADARGPARRQRIRRRSVLPVLYIHVLGLSDPAAIRDDVRRLERLVTAAITPTWTDATFGANGRSRRGGCAMNVVGWVSGVMLAAAGLLTAVHVVRCPATSSTGRSASTCSSR